MVAIFIGKNHICALFSKSILVIPKKLDRDIAKDKGRIWSQTSCPRQMAAILIIWSYIFALLSKSILVIPKKLDREIAKDKGRLVSEFDPKPLDLGKWRPF